MIVTDEEAQQMECARDRAFMCCGNGCMAWQSLDGLKMPLPEGAGYCGLAGTPAVVVAWTMTKVGRSI